MSEIGEPLPMMTVADVVTIDLVGGGTTENAEPCVATENAEPSGATENAVEEARYDRVEGRVEATTAVVVEAVDVVTALDVPGDEVVNGVEFEEYWFWDGMRKN